MTNFHKNEAMFVSSLSLQVRDFKDMLNFYQKYLGLTVITSTNDYASLSINKKDVVLELFANSSSEVAINKFGLYHFALLFKDQQALANVFLNLVNLNYKFSGFSDHGVSEAIYLNDPEGNGIELYWDRPQKEWPIDQTGAITMYTEYLDYNKYLIIADENFTALDKDTVLGHIHLYVENLNTAKNFFVKTLGFDMVLDFASSAHFVSTNKYHHHVGYNVWLKGAAYKKDNQTGMLGYTLSLTKKKYDQILDHLNEQNIKVTLNKNSQPTIKDINNCTVTFLIK